MKSKSTLLLILALIFAGQVNAQKVIVDLDKEADFT
jgi:hypothetical protein